METIEEAAKNLDAAVRRVRRLPWGERSDGTAQVLAHYEAKKWALALAAARAMLPPRSLPGAKTGIETRYLGVKARIDRLA